MTAPYNWDTARITASTLLRVEKQPGIRFGALAHGLIPERRVEKLMTDGLLSRRSEAVAYLGGPMLDLTPAGRAFLADYRERIERLAGRKPAGRVSGVKCAKKIRVQRKGYTRRDGTVVRPTTYVECDPGRPGRLTRGSKAGPYKKKPKWITGAGKLGGKGFTKRPERERHAILNDSVGFYGYATTTRMLQVILRSTTIADETRRRVESDLAWMKRKYRGKPGRASGRARRYHVVFQAQGPHLVQIGFFATRPAAKKLAAQYPRTSVSLTYPSRHSFEPKKR